MATLHDLPWISYMEVFRWRMNNFSINCCNIPWSFPEIWSAPINHLHLQCSETSNSKATLHGLPWISNSIFATLNMEVSHWRINKLSINPCRIPCGGFSLEVEQLAIERPKFQLSRNLEIILTFLKYSRNFCNLQHVGFQLNCRTKTLPVKIYFFHPTGAYLK